MLPPLLYLCSLVRPAALLSTRRIPAAVPVYGRRRVLLNRGWSLGEEEDHHNSGRKARQRPKPRCRSEAAFRRLCTPARHTPYRPRLPAGRFPAPSTATQAHRTISYQLSSPLRTACFNSSRSWSSGWVRARSKFRISPSRLGAGLGCCFIFSYRSRTAMGILPWHI